MEANKAEQRAAKAVQSANQTKSLPTRSRKLREAERHSKAALDHREKATKPPAKKIVEVQKNIARYEKNASEALRREREKEKRNRERDERRQAAEEALAEERAARLAEVRNHQIAQLEEDTETLRAELEKIRASAPSQITVLIMAGAPGEGRSQLRLDREQREIGERVQASPYRDQVDLQLMHAARVRDIIDGFNRHTPAIVHFSGHGADNELLFDDHSGRHQVLNGDHLAMLLEAAPTRLRLVVFNSCNSHELAALASGYADAAIGMAASIGDETAKEFSGQLYASLAAGQPLSTAFKQAKAQLSVIGDGTGDPQLFTADSVLPETLVLVAPPAED